ncbi:hypothetical protein [Kutzneria sp. 744]|uniref:hypothetical protein n=1 Tax=Kutzneria sp. (strain 744) TaxID=345341 RepID=UPI0004BCE7F3|nr:hypothetical protein [Kutzneria sp. 744]
MFRTARRRWAWRGRHLRRHTAEPYRRRGIGTLQATELGLPVYDRMGFEALGQYELFQLS